MREGAIGSRRVELESGTRRQESGRKVKCKKFACMSLACKPGGRKKFCDFNDELVMW